jgi:DNA-binding NarL/FixJ family response regulator
VGLRILLVDDHTLVRAGLRVLVESLPNIESILEAGDGDEALKVLEKHTFDVVLTDIQMPKLSGLEVVSRLHQSKSKSRVIVVSMYANEEYVLRALNNGAAGYLLKDAGPDELALAIGTAMRGDTYVDSRVATKLSDYVRRVGNASNPLDLLTPRQREVLQLVVQGYSTKEIAKTLDVSIKTVEAHRSQLMENLGIEDVTGLVRFAIRHGLISTEP